MRPFPPILMGKGSLTASSAGPSSTRQPLPNLPASLFLPHPQFRQPQTASSDQASTERCRRVRHRRVPASCPATPSLPVSAIHPIPSLPSTPPFLPSSLGALRLNRVNACASPPPERGHHGPNHRFWFLIICASCARCYFQLRRDVVVAPPCHWIDRTRHSCSLLWHHHLLAAAR